MRTTTTGITAATLVAGLFGSVAAYRASVEPAAGPDEATSQTSQTTQTTQTTARPQRRPRVRWAPCERPAELEDGVCVTDVVRSIVIAPAPTRGTVRPAASRGDYGDDDHDGQVAAGHHEDEVDHECAEVEDADHEDSDHEDDHEESEHRG